MNIVKKAYAKINLSIDVLSKREDNYHELDMIIQSVNLYDLINIEKNDSGIIHLECDDKNLPTDIKNDAYKAAYLMKKKFNILSGYKIKIKKNIPIEAGLGGGSSDAACVINAICSLENIKASDEKLFELGLKIGAELPYSIKSGLSRVRGIGEKIERIDIRPNYFFTIVKPKISLSTKKIFTKYKLIEKKINYTEKLYQALNSRTQFLDFMHNDLEKSSFAMDDELAKIKNEFIKLGAINALMSGSGPCIYGVFSNFDDAKKLAQYFIGKGYMSYAVEPIYF